MTGITATEGADFTAVSTCHGHHPDERQHRHGEVFQFTPVDNVVFEPRETVSVSGSTTVTGLTVTSATLGITDNDDNPPSRLVSVTLDTDPGEGTSRSVAERSNAPVPVTVTAVLAGPTARAASVSVSIAGGTATAGWITLRSRTSR